MGAKWSELLAPFPAFTLIMTAFSHRRHGPEAAHQLLYGVIVGAWRDRLFLHCGVINLGPFITFTLLEHRPADRRTGVTSDHIIEVASSLRLRRIGYRDQESGKRYTFLTNHFRLSAKTIADIYRERWQIELFFKEIRQNLRIRSVVGNSENAVLIQICTDLTVYLLLKYQKFLSRLGLSVQQLFQLIQLTLFGTASLEALLNPRRRKNTNPL